GNQDAILANEVDGDSDTIYSAWNGGAATVNIKDGAISRAKLSTTDVTPSLPPIPIATDANKTVVVNAAGNGLILGTGGTFAGATPPATPQVGQLWWRSDPDGNLFIYYDDGNSKQFVPAVPSSVGPWSVSGSTLTPTNATMQAVSVPGDATKASLILSNYSTGARVRAKANNSPGTIPFLAPTATRDAVSGVVDDTTKPAWQILPRPDADTMNIGRVPAGGALATLLTLDNTGSLTAPGNLNLQGVDAGWAHIYVGG